MKVTQGQQLSAAIVGGSGDEPTSLDSPFTLDRIKANEIQGDMPQDDQL